MRKQQSKGDNQIAAFNQSEGNKQSELHILEDTDSIPRLDELLDDAHQTGIVVEIPDEDGDDDEGEVEIRMPIARLMQKEQELTQIDE